MSRTFLIAMDSLVWRVDHLSWSQHLALRRQHIDLVDLGLNVGHTLLLTLNRLAFEHLVLLLDLQQVVLQGSRFELACFLLT